MNRKEQIIRNSISLFAENCYREVTMKMIARKCRLTDAALYRHFSSKDELYHEVLISIRDKISPNGFLESLNSESDLKIILNSLARYIANTYCENEQIMRLLLFSSLEEHEMAKEIYYSSRMPYIKFLSGKLKKLMKDGIVVEINSQITARCFIGMLFDCVMNSTLWKGMAGKEYNHETLMKNNIPIFLRGLIASN